jgi:hypothetical protein
MAREQVSAASLQDAHLRRSIVRWCRSCLARPPTAAWKPPASSGVWLIETFPREKRAAKRQHPTFKIGQHGAERFYRDLRGDSGPKARPHTSLGQRPRFPSREEEGLKARPIIQSHTYASSYLYAVFGEEQSHLLLKGAFSMVIGLTIDKQRPLLLSQARSSAKSLSSLQCRRPDLIAIVPRSL